MNGTGRPCENPTTNIAVLPLVYFFAQGMCLYLLRSGFSAGLRRAKTTEVCGKHWLAPLRLAKTTETCAKHWLAPLRLAKITEIRAKH